MTITLLDFVKSRGTSRLKNLVLKTFSDNRVYQIDHCSKHRSIKHKIINLSYTGKKPIRDKLIDHYDDIIQ